MALTLQSNQQVTASLAFADASGAAVTAPAGAKAIWGVGGTDTSGNNLLTFTPSIDTLSASISTVGGVGAGTVSVSVTFPTGTSPLTATSNVTVVAAPSNAIPTSVAIVFGPPVATLV